LHEQTEDLSQFPIRRSRHDACFQGQEFAGSAQFLEQVVALGVREGSMVGVFVRGRQSDDGARVANRRRESAKSGEGRPIGRGEILEDARTAVPSSGNTSVSFTPGIRPMVPSSEQGEPTKSVRW
jgi:hypothetical protein